MPRQSLLKNIQSRRQKREKNNKKDLNENLLNGNENPAKMDPKPTQTAKTQKQTKKTQNRPAKTQNQTAKNSSQSSTVTQQELEKLMAKNPDDYFVSPDGTIRTKPLKNGRYLKDTERRRNRNIEHNSIFKRTEKNLLVALARALSKKGSTFDISIEDVVNESEYRKITFYRHSENVATFSEAKLKEVVEDAKNKKQEYLERVAENNLAVTPGIFWKQYLIFLVRNPEVIMVDRYGERGKIPKAIYDQFSEYFQKIWPSYGKEIDQALLEQQFGEAYPLIRRWIDLDLTLDLLEEVQAQLVALTNSFLQRNLDWVSRSIMVDANVDPKILATSKEKDRQRREGEPPEKNVKHYSSKARANIEAAIKKRAEELRIEKMADESNESNEPVESTESNK